MGNSTIKEVTCEGCNTKFEISEQNTKGNKLWNLCPRCAIITAQHGRKPKYVAKPADLPADLS